MKGVALITARSGSKGFKNKNIAKINNKTLIEYAVASVENSVHIDEVFISTDSKQYENIALMAGAKTQGLRPNFLSTDTAKSIDVVRNFLQKFGNEKPDYVVLLQPTSPQRTVEQIDECIGIHLNMNQSVVSVSKIDEPHPYKMKLINEMGNITPFVGGASSDVPRQMLPPVYSLTGAIYVASTECILNEGSFFSSMTKPYITPNFTNIDSEDDYLYLKYLVDTGKVSLEC